MIAFLKGILIAAQPYLLRYLQTAVVKKSLSLFFKVAVPGGLRVWFVKFFAKNILFNKILQPAVQEAFREVGYRMDVKHGKVLIQKLTKAIDENDQENFDNTMDDIIG